MSDTRPRLDPYSDPPRAFVGNLETRLIHRTDSDDEACDVGARPVYSDSLAALLAEEWTGYRYEQGPFLEGEKPADYGLAKDAETRLHAIAVPRRFRECPVCQPGED